jgi:hypothetical protein
VVLCSITQVLALAAIVVTVDAVDELDALLAR